MKILQITSTFSPIIGGQEKVVEEISKGLAKLGHDVTILTTNLLCEKENLPKKEKINGIKVIRCENDFFLGGYGYSEEAVNWLKGNWDKYDAIHCHGYNRFLGEFATYYLRNKKPVVFTPHGFIHTRKNIFFKIIHNLTFGIAIKYAKICTALTKLDFKDYENLGVKKEKIIEIPNGINLKDFKNINKKEVSKFKKRISQNKPMLLFVGRIHESKGLQYTIKAIKNLEIAFAIVGKDAGYKEELTRIIKKENLREKAIFLGSLNNQDLLKAYFSCDFFILFSEWEGFGISVLEAMASGKPVIVSDKGSLPLLVTDKKEGLIVPFKNVSLLEEKIKYLMNNRKMCKKMGEVGKSKAKNYDWGKIIKKLEEIYKR